MVKKIISAAAAIVLAVNTAVSAEYYGKTSLPQVSGKSLSYSEYDISVLTDIVHSAERLIVEPGNDLELSVKLDDAYKEVISAYDASSLAQLEADRNYSEETGNAAVKAEAIALEAFRVFDGMVLDIYNSDYKETLTNLFGEDKTESYISSRHSDEYYELMREENDLIGRYSGAFGNSDSCANLFIKLVRVRNKIAAIEGYDNYADYASQVIYGREYTDEEIQGFCEAVSDYLTPLYKPMLQMYTGMQGNYKIKSDAEITTLVGEVLGSINDELRSSYDYMINNDLYDIECRDGKAKTAGAYTAQLFTYKVPYLFMAYSSESNMRLRGFIHETGHFCSLLNTLSDSSLKPELETMYVDTCEIHSQGLEVLTEKYYGKLFGSDASYERISEIYGIINNVLDGCFYNEWQTRIYQEPRLTVDRANEIASELTEKYYGVKMTKSSAQNMWTSTPHNFHSPMYYISYSLSGAAALELYAVSVDDYDEAVDKYMRISSAGGYVPFDTALNAAGLDSVFDTQVIRDISDTIRREFALSYSDVDYGSCWYEPYLYQVSHIFNGRGMNAFEPHSNITRTEFAGLIGRMYDYYEGIDGSYTLVFDDVSYDDPDARYIMWASGNGIITGYSDRKFGGDDEITREQLVTILYRLNALENSSEVDDALVSGFDDAELVSDWAELPMAWAITNDIVSGRDNNTIAPQDNTTRAEAAKLAACFIQAQY
ncbi:MAG: S-layer homology domain-containing protein [Oscillospiraceae bacterium]|nr:S-layer homology domain-containing protein [Oscillospiraceae bacterium]